MFALSIEDHEEVPLARSQQQAAEVIPTALAPIDADHGLHLATQGTFGTVTVTTGFFFCSGASRNVGSANKLNANGAAMRSP